MKILILGSIFALITYTGFKFGNNYKEKENFYNDFVRFLINLKTQINFLKTDIIQILNNYKTNNKNLNKLLLDYKNSIVNDKEFKIELNILTEDEKVEILTFFNTFGKSDLYTQIDLLEKYNKFFEDKLEEKRKLNVKYGVMYKKLGILLGLLVCIVLI